MRMITSTPLAKVEDESVQDAAASRWCASWRVAGDYWALTKPEVNSLIAISTLTGFCLGCFTQSHRFSVFLLLHTVLGTLLVASGTGTLNQYLERHFDTRMRRTARRPLAAGRLKPTNVLLFGLLLSCAGVLYLAVAVNALASLLAVFTWATYLLLYTPLKRKTPACTLIGALPGAMPPLIGWAAASGRLDAQAWVLYGMLFLWQFPHFMAIAWMYREDYARAGYLVLPRGKQRERMVAWLSVGPSLVLAPLSLAPVFLGSSSMIYLGGAALLSLGFLYHGARFAIHRTNVVARKLLFASIIYLPSVFLLLLIDSAVLA
jgi:protoheme IX farnesyltransferase